MLLLKQEPSIPFLSEIVFETVPGGGALSVVRDGVGLGSVIAVVASSSEAFALEKRCRGGAVFGVKPLLNPA